MLKQEFSCAFQDVCRIDSLTRRWLKDFQQSIYKNVYSPRFCQKCRLKKCLKVLSFCVSNLLVRSNWYLTRLGWKGNGSWAMAERRSMMFSSCRQTWWNEDTNLVTWFLVFISSFWNLLCSSYRFTPSLLASCCQLLEITQKVELSQSLAHSINKQTLAQNINKQPLAHPCLEPSYRNFLGSGDEEA